MRVPLATSLVFFALYLRFAATAAIPIPSDNSADKRGLAVAVSDGGDISSVGKRGLAVTVAGEGDIDIAVKPNPDWWK